MSERLRAAYDATLYRDQARAWIDQLSHYLARANNAEAALPVMPSGSYERLAGLFPAEFDANPATTAASLLQRVLDNSTHLHHPHFVGHQVTAPLPLAALAEHVSALLNNGMAVFEMGPAATAMEAALVRFFADRFGFPAQADGVLTSGGSAGNLTALLAARQARAGFDVWREGAQAGPPLALLVSDQAHYCVARSAALMGWGAGGAYRVGCDPQHRLDPKALAAALDSAQRAGRRPVAVVASACTTATGSFDPIEPIAEFCAREGLWLHVDAAHGGAAILSPKYRSLLAGIERADSLVLDFHKMLLMPALATLVLFRDGRHSHAAFDQEASYLFTADGAAGPSHDLGRRTLECTKRMAALPMYLSLSTYGPAFFGEYITQCFDLARDFAETIHESADFELAVQPQSNIVCFRYRHEGVPNDRLDELQTTIRRRVLETGAFYLVQTSLPTGVFLRVTLIHPLTVLDDLRALLSALRSAAQSQ